MKLAFLLPFINHAFPASNKWLPLSSPTLIGSIKDSFPGVSFEQLDLEEELKATLERDRLLPVLNSQRMDFSEKAGLERYDELLSAMVDRLQLGQYDHYLFTFYNRNRIGINASLLLARYLKITYPGKKIVFGGLYGYGGDMDTKSFKDLPFVDCWVVGPGEIPLTQILNKLLNGEEIENYYSGYGLAKNPDFMRYFSKLPDFKSFKSLKFFSYSCSDLAREYKVHLGAELTETGKEILFLPYRFTTGCFWRRCAYCAGSGTSMRHLHKSTAAIVKDLKELKEIYGTRYFIFYNRNFNFNMQFAKELLKRFIDEKLDILWTDSFNLVVVDDELTELLARAGCFRADIGVTTLDPKIQKMHNNILQDNKYLDNLRKLSEKGIWTHINLIANLPYQYSLEEDKKILHRHMAHIDGATINSFRKYNSSDLDRNHDKYNLRLISENIDELETGMSFIEKDYPGTLQERKELFIRSYRELTTFFSEHPDFTTTVNQVHLYLLGHLYGELGFSRKKAIKETVSRLSCPGGPIDRRQQQL